MREISTGNIAIHTITLASNGKTIAVRGSLPEKEDGTSPNVIGMLDIGSGKAGASARTEGKGIRRRCHPHYAESQDGRVAEQSNGPSPVRDAVSWLNPPAPVPARRRPTWPGNLAGQLHVRCCPGGQTRQTRKAMLVEMAERRRTREIRVPRGHWIAMAFSPMASLLAAGAAA